MTTLIIGSTGNAGSGVANALFKLHRPILLASRSGLIHARFPPSSPLVASVQFDWTKPSAWESAFSASILQPSLPPVDRVFFIIPSGVVDPVKTAEEFVDLAADRGVKKFVFLSAAPAKKGGPVPMGQIHDYLDKKGVECFTLRPTWFIDNLAQFWIKSILEDDEIPTAAGDGKVWLVSAKDIGEAVAEKLTSSDPIHGEALILGPELLSYGEVADIFSDVLGRKIVKRDLTYEEAVKFWAIGGDEILGGRLTKLEQLVAGGAEERHGSEEHIRGKVYLRAWVEENKAVFSKN